MTWLAKAAKTFLRDEDGVSIVEYALLFALIAFACIGVISVLGAKLDSLFSSFSSTI